MIKSDIYDKMRKAFEEANRKGETLCIAVEGKLKTVVKTVLSEDKETLYIHLDDNTIISACEVNPIKLYTLSFMDDIG